MRIAVYSAALIVNVIEACFNHGEWYSAANVGAAGFFVSLLFERFREEWRKG